MTTKTLTLEVSKPILKDIALVLLASFAIALSGKISIPLWFTPVPLITQNTVILLLAVLLGSKRASAATFAFLFQGAIGLPVFSAGVTMGVARLVGPTGGYLIGYLIAAFVVGWMFERAKEKSLMGAFKAMAVGNLIIWVSGAGYLSTFIGVEKAFLLGVAPFVIGDLFKILAGLKILQWIKR